MKRAAPRSIKNQVRLFDAALFECARQQIRLAARFDVERDLVDRLDHRVIIFSVWEAVRDEFS